MLRLICSILAIVWINSDITNSKQGDMYRKHDTDVIGSIPIHYNVSTVINEVYSVDVEVYM